MSEDIIKSLIDAVVKMYTDDTPELTKKLMDAGMAGQDILNRALIPALDQVGVLFRDEEYFLPDVLMCVKAYNNAYELIEPSLMEGNFKPRGTILLGTVEGDIHDIGKNIVAALLKGNGFNVIDIGTNMPAQEFLDKARELRPDIIGMSALLTTTMPEMEKIITLFDSEGIRGDYKFIVGGAPVTKEFASEIGADGYGEDAQAGVELVKSLIA